MVGKADKKTKRRKKIFFFIRHYRLEMDRNLSVESQPMQELKSLFDEVRQISCLLFIVKFVYLFFVFFFLILLRLIRIITDTSRIENYAHSSLPTITNYRRTSSIKYTRAPTEMETAD